MSLINTKVKPFRAQAFKDGKFLEVSDTSLAGKWSVFVFYPADFTFICPTELEDLADRQPAVARDGDQSHDEALFVVLARASRIVAVLGDLADYGPKIVFLRLVQAVSVGRIDEARGWRLAGRLLRVGGRVRLGDLGQR